MKKLIPATFIIFSLILSGCSNTEKSPTNSEEPADSVSEWQTYNGTEFELKYPSSWQATLEQNGVRTTVSLKNNESPVFSISVAPNQGGISLEDWSTEIINQSGYEYVETVSIDSLAAHKLTLSETEAGPRYLFITPFTSGRAGSKMFDITTMGLDQALIDEIIATLRITAAL